MKILKQIILAIGIALLIGIATGYFTSEKKYLFLSLENGKKEITEERYKKLSSRGKSNVRVEAIFNLKWGMISGFTVLGINIVLIGLKMKTD